MCEITVLLGLAETISEPQLAASRVIGDAFSSFCWLSNRWVDGYLGTQIWTGPVVFIPASFPSLNSLRISIWLFPPYGQNFAVCTLKACHLFQGKNVAKYTVSHRYSYILPVLWVVLCPWSVSPFSRFVLETSSRGLHFPVISLPQLACSQVPIIY